MAAALSGTDLGFSYFRLPSVRSADSLATKEAPHQLEDGPPLIAFGRDDTERWASRGRIAGESIAVTLAQIRVVVAQIEGEHLPGEAKTDVPGVVVGIRDTVRIVREKAARGSDNGADELQP